MKLSELVKILKKASLFEIEETENVGAAIVNTSDLREPPKTTYKIINIAKFNRAIIRPHIYYDNDQDICMFLDVFARPFPPLSAIIEAIKMNKQNLMDFGFVDDFEKRREK